VARIVLTVLLLVSFSGCYTVLVPEDPDWKEWPAMPKKTQQRFSCHEWQHERIGTKEKGLRVSAVSP
jgi:hypothetical protein